MSKKDFIALADVIRTANHEAENDGLDLVFKAAAVQALATFCATQNPLFKRERWLDYIAGNCGPGGGRVKS